MPPRKCRRLIVEVECCCNVVNHPSMLKVPLQLHYRMSLSCVSIIYRHRTRISIIIIVSDTNTIITSNIYLLRLLLCCISHHKHHRLSTESLSRTTTITLQYIPNFANHIIVVIMFVYAHTSSRQIMIWQ